MSDNDAVLFANEAFYRAFADRDLRAMDEAWARSHPVACIHPGWEPLFGRDAELRSWQAILAGPQSPRIDCVAPRAFVLGAAAYVICFEDLDGGYLVATNVFVREGSLWRMIHHQAGPTAAAPAREQPEEQPVH